MKILDDLMSILNFDAIVKDIRQGIFHTGVLTQYCGLAATLPRDALSGTKVVDSDLALRCVSQGANFRQIMGVKRLTMMR
jgi:hypothetical protein